jgi:hypothetical protein
MPGIDYRKLPYNPKSGRRGLVACLIMTITGLAIFASLAANVFERGIAFFGHRVSLGFAPIMLVGLGIFNAIPAVMMLTPHSKR